jgi:hypothetical protein
VKALVKEKMFIKKSRENAERARSKLDALTDFTRQCDFFVRQAILKKMADKFTKYKI